MSTQGILYFEKEDQSVEKIHEIKAINGLLIDENFLYAAAHEEDNGNEACLMIIDFTKLLKEKKLVSYTLKKMSFGPNGMMEYNFRNDRIAILDSHSRFMIFPLLHRNVVPFAGIPQTAKMIAVQKVSHYLCCLLESNQISTFNTYTTHCENLVSISKDIIDCSKYIPFDYHYERQQGDKTSPTWCNLWRNFTLVYAEEPLEIEPISFTESAPRPGIKRAHTEHDYTFHEFKVIEIVDDTTVQVHKQFVFRVLKEDSD